MEQRAKTICVMFVTMDGNPISELMWDEKLDGPVAEYNRIMLTEGEAFGAGRNTMQLDIEVDMTPYKEVPVTYEDVIAGPENEPLCFIIDRFGKLRWEYNYYVEEGCINSRIIEVLTEKAPSESLAYYNAMNIPYLFAGKEDFDPQLFLEKIHKDYHVETFMLAGGPILNGVFAEAGLMDEVILVVAPYIDGGADTVPFVLGKGLKNPDAPYHLKNVRVAEGDVIVAHYVK